MKRIIPAAAVLVASFVGYDALRRESIRAEPYQAPPRNDAAHIAKAEEKRRRRAMKKGGA